MPSITVKNIPEEIYNKIRSQAESHHRSINSEIIACLEQYTHAHRVSEEEILYEARRLRKRARGKLSSDEIDQAINHGRP
jgi:plasmid stability protein